MNHLEEVWTETEGSDGSVSVESKYLHKWEYPSEKQQREATDKAIREYDSHQSLDRSTDMSDIELKEYRIKMWVHGHEIVSLDCTVVRDAKIKGGVLQGKVRLEPRGYLDRTLKASWFKTSPTASAVSVRVTELIGMRLGLSSWVVDVSDAFFSGEELRDDGYIVIKVPADLSETGCSVWRRLKREVPGCKGA